MNKKYWISLIIIFLFLGCDYFQQKTYTKKGDRIGRIYELCIKGNTTKGASGGNVLHCKEIQDDLTEAGKFENYKTCVDWVTANPKKSKGFNCYKEIYGYEE